MERPRGLGLVFQLKVYCRLVGKRYSRKHLHGLVVLHNLDRADIIMAYAVGGYAVAATEKIRAFDIELVDVLSLILYLSVLCHVDARHSAQNIADRAVVLPREGAHVVCYGVALLTDAVGLYRHFLQLYSSRFEIHSEWKGNTVERNRLPGETHNRHFQATAGHCRHRHGESAVGLRRCELLYLSVGTFYNHRCTGNRLVAVSFQNRARNGNLRHGEWHGKNRQQRY